MPPVGSPTSHWPSQKPSELNAYYGNPDPHHLGVPARPWEDMYLTPIIPPYNMYLAWAPHQRVTTIKVNKNCSVSLLRILQAIKDHYGSPAEIEKARMHLYGGAYCFRLMRGGTALSMHSWGCAIDLDPETNVFGRSYDASRGMMPQPVVKIFQAEGWTWGGEWSKPDCMHFQAAHL